MKKSYTFNLNWIFVLSSLVLLVLKLTGVADISWWIVAAPILFGLFLAVSIAIFGMIIMGLAGGLFFQIAKNHPEMIKVKNAIDRERKKL